MQERERGENQPATYQVTLPAWMTGALGEFLRRRGAEFRPMDMAIRLNDAGSDPEIIHGYEAANRLAEINRFLRKRRIHPLVPGAPDTWTAAQLHEFLELAMEHFAWEYGDEPTGAWWLDEGVTWPEVTGRFTALFGKQPAAADWPPGEADPGESPEERLEDVNRHLRRMAGAVLNDDQAVRLIGQLRERKVLEREEVLDQAVPLARLAAANFCEVGAESIWITHAGMVFVDSIISAGREQE